MDVCGGEGCDGDKFGLDEDAEFAWALLFAWAVAVAFASATATASCIFFFSSLSFLSFFSFLLCFLSEPPFRMRIKFPAVRPLELDLDLPLLDEMEELEDLLLFSDLSVASVLLLCLLLRSFRRPCANFPDPLVALPFLTLGLSPRTLETQSATVRVNVFFSSLRMVSLSMSWIRLRSALEANLSSRLESSPHESLRRALLELLEPWVQVSLDLLFHLPFPFAPFPAPLPVRSWLLLPWNILFQLDLVAYGTLLFPTLVGNLSSGVAA